jgi:hypothetical protein
LWTARRYDLPLEATLALIESRFRQTEYPGGGWGYIYNDEGPSSANTCVGLLGLAIGHAWRPEEQSLGGTRGAASADDAGITRGLRTLRKFLGSTARENIYFLWAVERVGVLLRLRTIGGMDWYRLGASYLLRVQRPNGSWFVTNSNGSPASGSYSPTVDTCLALLFLKRADLLPGLGEELRKRVLITDPGPMRKGNPPKVAAKAPPGKPAPLPEGMPLAVSLGDLKAGVASERQVRVRCATAFRITDIKGTDSAVQASTPSTPQKVHTLTLTLHPSAAGELSRTLRLVTDLPDRREVEVTIKARAVP